MLDQEGELFELDRQIDRDDTDAVRRRNTTGREVEQSLSPRAVQHVRHCLRRPPTARSARRVPLATGNRVRDWIDRLDLVNPSTDLADFRGVGIEQANNLEPLRRKP